MTDQEIKEAFKALNQQPESMTEYQAEFVASLRKYFKRNKMLSEKQAAALLEIATNLKSNDKTKI